MRRRNLSKILPGVGLGLLTALLIWALRTQPGSFAPPELQPGSQDSLTVLTANVGNGDPRCVGQILKLCRKDVEVRLTENIAALRPELVALQETLADALCEGLPATDSGNVCSGTYDEPQVRRLLGPDYTIVCESRNLIECIGVRTDVGEILGCERGARCESDRVAERPEGCRRHVAVFAVTVQIKGRTFDVVNAHPENRNAACRLETIRQVFEGDVLSKIVAEGRSSKDRPSDLRVEDRSPNVLIMGDLNFDPWRTSDVSAEYWNSQVGSPETHEFYYHSGSAEHEPPYPTIRYPFLVRTFDHVVSNFLTGSTLTLGESPGTTRLDGGAGTDHRAVFGSLEFPE